MPELFSFYFFPLFSLESKMNARVIFFLFFSLFPLESKIKEKKLGKEYSSEGMCFFPHTYYAYSLT
jgi:hypothetical protein